MFEPKNNSLQRQQERGFSLVEILVALGILAVILMAVTSAMLSTSKGQQEQVTKIESNELFGGFARYLLTREGCEAALVGKTLSASDQALQVSSYGGFGSSTATIQSGTVIDKKLKVNKLEWREKSSAVDSQVGVSGLNRTRKVAHIQFQYALIEAGNERNLRDRIIDLPVLVDSANVVKACDLDVSNQSMCDAIGMKWNAGTQSCDPEKNCESKGSFIDYSWSGDADAQDAPRNAAVNPLTGGYNCPAGAQKIMTYVDTWDNTYVDVTKKSSVTYTATMKETFYTCLKCP